jgi:hypothetical protein
MPLSQWTAFFETPNVRESLLSAFIDNLENYKQTALHTVTSTSSISPQTTIKTTTKQTTTTTTTMATKAKPATNLSVHNTSRCTAHTSMEQDAIQAQVLCTHKEHGCASGTELLSSVRVLRTRNASVRVEKHLQRASVRGENTWQIQRKHNFQ